MKMICQQNGSITYEGTPKELCEHTKYMYELMDKLENKKEEKTIIMDLNRLSNKK